MITMIKRGFLLFFKDKASLLFSLLGVIILFLLYIFFLGDSLVKELDFLPNAEFVMNSWIVAGMLASSSITTSMGAYAIMVSDKENKYIKDFYTSPISKKAILGGYLFTGFIISVIMTLITFFIGEVYIIIKGGHFISFTNFLLLICIILLSSFASSAMVCFVVSFLKSINSYITISIILGTLIGFLIGAYICIGDLPSSIQWIIKIFPCAHSAVLFRQLLMKEGITVGFKDMPTEVSEQFKEKTGVIFSYNGWIPDNWFYILTLVLTGLIFYLLVIIISKKKAKN